MLMVDSKCAYDGECARVGWGAEFDGVEGEGEGEGGEQDLEGGWESV